MKVPDILAVSEEVVALLEKYTKETRIATVILDIAKQAFRATRISSPEPPESY